MPHFLTAIRSGLRTGEPKWVIPGLVLLAAAVFVLANLPTGQPAPVSGRVTGCVSSVARLTGGQYVTCTFALSDGTVQRSEVSAFLTPGTVVTFRRYDRRLIGSVYAL